MLQETDCADSQRFIWLEQISIGRKTHTNCLIKAKMSLKWQNTVTSNQSHTLLNLNKY